MMIIDYSANKLLQVIVTKFPNNTNNQKPHQLGEIALKIHCLSVVHQTGKVTSNILDLIRGTRFKWILGFINIHTQTVI